MAYNAENYQNREDIELAWAVKAQETAEIHYNIITSIDASHIKLSSHDDRIYTEFRSAFPDFDVSKITEDDLKTPDAKKLWRQFCNKFEDVEDFNYGSLLRLDPLLEYNNENTMFATRIQFLAIEIARNREGWSKKLYEKIIAAKQAKLDDANRSNNKQSIST